MRDQRANRTSLGTVSLEATHDMTSTFPATPDQARHGRRPLSGQIGNTPATGDAVPVTIDVCPRLAGEMPLMNLRADIHARSGPAAANGRSDCGPYRRTFVGTADQVCEARRFLAGILGGHPATGDAITCLDELAANAVQHSNSARPGGTFTVRFRRSGAAIRIEVTDQGGPLGNPARQRRGTRTRTDHRPRLVRPPWHQHHRAYPQPA